MITEETIINFFEGKCDAREVAIVHAWLMENPAKLKEYMGVEEWEDFQPTDVLSPDISGKLWNGVHKEATPPVVGRSYVKWMGVAASVLLVIGLSWPLIVKKPAANNSISAAKTKRIFNNTLQKMTLTLSDGSSVELLPNSTLSYSDDFNSSKRDVSLNGEAIFDVAKDADKPFSVYSNTVLITVLGTRFTVNSCEADNSTKVILHEGRVMVKVPQKEYYLTPGDIFIFKKAMAPSRGGSPARIATLRAVSNDTLSAQVLHLEKNKEDGYVFNDYPLDVVFDQLQIIYDTKITYDKAALGNRTFIGKTDGKDSLSHILKSIALLNNFHLQKEGDGFVISN